MVHSDLEPDFDIFSFLMIMLEDIAPARCNNPCSPGWILKS